MTTLPNGVRVEGTFIYGTSKNDNIISDAFSSLLPAEFTQLDIMGNGGDDNLLPGYYWYGPSYSAKIRSFGGEGNDRMHSSEQNEEFYGGDGYDVVAIGRAFPTNSYSYTVSNGDIIFSGVNNSLGDRPFPFSIFISKDVEIIEADGGENSLIVSELAAGKVNYISEQEALERRRKFAPNDEDIRDAQGQSATMGSSGTSNGETTIINNITNIANTTNIVTYNISVDQNFYFDLGSGLTGSQRLGETVSGTAQDDKLIAGKGRDKLIGGAGADTFIFPEAIGFGKKQADAITDFSASEGDGIAVELSSSINQREAVLATATSKKSLKGLFSRKVDIIYFPRSGQLFYNENQEQPGVGDGGLFATLLNKPGNLETQDFVIY